VPELVQAGMPEEAAFRAVITRIGSKTELAAEYMKNDGFIEALCETLENWKSKRGAKPRCHQKNK
jgi:hypothetical protein